MEPAVQIDRRSFMSTLLAGAGATVAASRARAAAPTLTSPTQLVDLGKSGVRGSLVGLGTGMSGWRGQSNHTRMGLPAFTRLVDHAWERGIRFFDVADLYGTHPFLRQALAGKPRDAYTIMSKIWFAPGGLREPVSDARTAVERFLTELGTDRIEIVLLHCTTSGGWTTELRRMMDQLQELKAEGKVRAVGTSCHSRAALDSSLASDWVQVQLARINHRGNNMDGAPDDIAALLRSMRAAGRGVVGMKIMGEGSFREPDVREASLRYVLGQQCVDNFIVGFEQPAQIDETLGMVEKILAE